MATIDIPQTPPSASVAALRSLPNQNVSSSIHLSTSPHEPLSDLSSYADENSSFSSRQPLDCRSQVFSKAESASPQRMASLSPLSSARHMSFTPQRTRPLPRAWERRPATPFIARNDGQRIWKRVPLSELGGEVNLHVCKGEKEEKSIYIRVVKRLRLGAEENEIAHEVPGSIALAAVTRWDEDVIDKHGSPKKKTRRTATPTIFNASDAINQAAKSLPSPPPDCIEVESDNIDHMGYTNKNLEANETFKCLENDAKEAIQLICTNIGAIEPKIMAIETEDNLTLVNHNAQSEEPATVSAGSIDAPVQANSSEAIEAATLVSIGNIDQSQAQPAIVKMDNMHDSCLDSSQSVPELQLSDTEVTSIAPIADPAVSQLQLSHQTPDHDETAFLREFLERAQASKAARVAASPSKHPCSLSSLKSSEQQTGMPSTSPSGDQESAVADEAEDDDLSPPFAPAPQQLVWPASDIQPCSPMRRSARNAARSINSLIPRYTPVSAQHSTTSLPGTIQLKRASGHEFIFNAKSQQSLAMTTRSNTRRNQGDAVNVVLRLTQLKRDIELQEEDCVTDYTVAGNESVSDNLSTQVSNTKPTMLKRKRNKQDNGKPNTVKKHVRWPADDDLIHYQTTISSVSGSDTSDDLEDPESSTIQDPMKDINPVGQVTLLTPTSATVELRSVLEVSSQLKVRRTRKTKLDSVNGTPAPKTRIRAFPKSESTEFVPEMVANFNLAELKPRAASNASNVINSNMGTRKSSRMPVPVSIPVPLPSLLQMKQQASGASANVSNRTHDKIREEPNTALPLATTAGSKLRTPSKYSLDSMTVTANSRSATEICHDNNNRRSLRRRERN